MFTSLNQNVYGPPMPTLGSSKLTSRQFEEYRPDTTDRVLSDHGLERIPTDMPQHSIFGALALCLFRNQSHENLVLRKVREMLSELSISGKFSMRLHEFKNNRSLISSFSSKPYDDDYHRFVFDLVSLAFEVRVLVCSVPNHLGLLTETIYANKHKRAIRILDLGDGTYEALFPKGTFEKDKLEEGSVAEVGTF